jgi:hypothetical protein
LERQGVLLDKGLRKKKQTRHQDQNEDQVYQPSAKALVSESSHQPSHLLILFQRDKLRSL